MFCPLSSRRQPRKPCPVLTVTSPVSFSQNLNFSCISLEVAQCLANQIFFSSLIMPPPLLTPPRRRHCVSPLVHYCQPDDDADHRAYSLFFCGSAHHHATLPSPSRAHCQSDHAAVPRTLSPRCRTVARYHQVLDMPQSSHTSAGRK